MGNLGVFRDDFYNAIHILTACQAQAGPVATGVIAASLLAGAIENFVSVGGTSQTYTTDTAANIIAVLSTAIQAAYKANVGGFASSLGAQPAVSGIPNLFNMSFFIDIDAQGATTGATLAAGSGVTFGSTFAGLSPTALSITAPNRYVVQVTGPASITMTRVA
jgi:hypothetical protein